MKTHLWLQRDTQVEYWKLGLSREAMPWQGWMLCLTSKLLPQAPQFPEDPESSARFPTMVATTLGSFPHQIWVTSKGNVFTAPGYRKQPSIVFHCSGSFCPNINVSMCLWVDFGEVLALRTGWMHSGQNLSLPYIRSFVLSPSNWRWPWEATDPLAIWGMYVEKSIPPFRQPNCSMSPLWTDIVLVLGMPSSSEPHHMDNCFLHFEDSVSSCYMWANKVKPATRETAAIL